MSNKKVQPRESTFREGVLKPLGIALIFGIAAGLFLWGYVTSNIFVFLLHLLSWCILLGLGGLLIYFFFRMIKGMREGKSYTVFRANTTVKRFFEYVFVTIFTLGTGILLVIIVLREVIILLKAMYYYGGW